MPIEIDQTEQDAAPAPAEVAPEPTPSVPVLPGPPCIEWDAPWPGLPAPVKGALP